MDIEGAKTAVFGIGGAGCRILEGLAEALPANSALVALDRSRDELDKLPERVEKVKIGESLSKCGSSGEVREALSGELSGIEDSLEGVNMAVLVSGLGGKTGSCIGDFMAELCRKKGVFTLSVTVYPLAKKTDSKRMESSVKRMRDRVDGLLVVDNNLKRGKGGKPMLTVFNSVNAAIGDLIFGLVLSVSNAASMSLGKGELEHFFHGDDFFVVASGEGPNPEEALKKALGEADLCVEAASIKRVMILLLSPTDPNIKEMRGLNSAVQDRLKPDSVKWISAASEGNARVILVSAASELPLVQSIELPDEVGEGEEGESGGGKEAEAESRPDEGGGFEEFLAMQAKERDRGGKPRSPALVGLSPSGEGRKEAGRGEHGSGEDDIADSLSPGGADAREELSEEEEIEEIVDELVGFPSYRKKGQKKLGDYDELGIDYI